MTDEYEPLFAQIEPLPLEALRILRGVPYRRLACDHSLIPEYSGVYMWRYWPTFPDRSAAGILDVLKRWKTHQPAFEENVGNSRVDITVLRAPLGFSRTAELLGLRDEKIEALKAYLACSEEAREDFLVVMESIIAAAPPLYIGKADSLRARLLQHFEGKHKSELLTRIKASGIPLDDVYISILRDPAPPGAELNVLLEEVLQRITNPPLVKRYA